MHNTIDWMAAGIFFKVAGKRKKNGNGNEKQCVIKTTRTLLFVGAKQWTSKETRKKKPNIHKNR